MFIDSLLLEQALAAMFSDPDERWKDWGVEYIADWLMDWMEDHE